MTGRINGVALSALGAGSLFVYAGIRGYSIPHAVQSLISGKAPSTGGVASPITSPTGATLTGTGSGGGAAPGTGLTGTPPGGTYNHSQLVSLWIMAGGSQASANNAACHAIQESSGDAGALNVNGPGPGCDAVGLWQLATPCGKGAGYTVAQLKDPITNARVAVKGTSNGTDWSAWATPGC